MVVLRGLGEKKGWYKAGTMCSVVLNSGIYEWVKSFEKRATAVLMVKLFKVYNRTIMDWIIY